MTTAIAARELDPALDAAMVPAAPVPTDLLRIQPELFIPARPVATLQTAVRLARQGFGCDGAGVVLTGHGGGHATTWGSDADAARADAMQAEYHQGPAFDAVALGQPVVCPELRFDSRWRFWSPQTADLGFRSVLSLALGNGATFGALTLYSRRPSFFPMGSLEAELSFAQQVSIAVSVAMERDHLQRARDSREIVGQAQGILMERYQISAEQAFAVLRRYSSHLNQKLRLIAERVIRDRTLPELDPTTRSLDPVTHPRSSGYQA